MFGLETLFVLIDAGVLLFALIRMISMIKKMHNSLNLCYMLLHFAILVSLIVFNTFSVIYGFDLHLSAHQYLYLANTGLTVDFILNILMFIVMFKASGNLQLPDT